MTQWRPLFDSICTSAKFADLPDDSCRVLYLMLIASADPWGRKDARPRKLCASVWPLIPGKTEEETARALDVLREAGLVDVYWPEGRDPFLAFPDWEEKAGSVGRRSHRSPSAHPDPVDCADCKLPGGSGHLRADPGKTGRSRALPGEAGHASSPLLSLSVSSPEGESEREVAAPTKSQTWETVLALPEFDALRADPGWMAAWSDWIEHARTPGTKARVPKPKGARAAFRYALEVGPAAHAEAIQASIRNDWQGINVEWVRRGGTGANGRVQSHADRAIEDFKAMGGTFSGPAFGEDETPQIGRRA